uniref:5'-(N(7)-methylguanosine 5'-triphospho)-[mRNA] hydrolase n=1 Tax=Myotis myotis TaxID=51298 RepID=A0A7J7Z221_MYOMY|nr:decapping mRNA 1B [Myotis myotis]
MWKEPYLFTQVSIYGIWFYDKEECQRIAELMKNLTQYEQLRAHQEAGAGISPMILSSGEGKEVDILRMLTKAKDEYTKTLDPEPQHLSLTALFGKQDKATCQETVGPAQTLHQQQQQEKLPIRQGVIRSLSYEEPKGHSPPIEKQLCPAIQKLLVRSADLHPLSELPENQPYKNGSEAPAREDFTGPVLLGSPQSFGASHRVHGASRTRNLLEKLQSTPGAVNKYDPGAPAPAGLASLSFTALPAATPAAPGKAVAQPPLVHFNGSLPPQALGHQAHEKDQSACPRQMLALSGGQTSGSGVISPQELLQKLQLVQQEQQLHMSNRPALAAKFPVLTQSSGAGKPWEPWVDKTSSTEKQTPRFQVISPQCIRATVAPSLLMSPMVFTQPTCSPSKERDRGLLSLGSQEPAAASTSLFLPLQSPEPSVLSPLTKLQLQEALLFLIQNDDNFLNIIYEAYLFNMTQATMKKTM